MIETLSISAVLSSAIAPVTLITGVALLTSIMAPRFGRRIDRLRTVLAQIKTLPTSSRDYENHLKQLGSLYHRTRVLRNTMAVAGVCILFVVLTIAATFSHLLVGLPTKGVVIVTFLLSLAWLMLLTLGFIYDFLSSLSAVRLEIDHGLEIETSDLPSLQRARTDMAHA